jgi:hypothetical protein
MSQSYGAVVGTVDTSSEKPLTGPNGDHLQFELEVGPSLSYQVDINTQSRNGSAVRIYVADETLQPDSPSAPFGPPTYGVFTDAKLSYKDTGLQNAQFVATTHARIESQLEASLGQAEFVVAYGQMFDDGGDNGRGIHETHRNPQGFDQDGAIVVYLTAELGKPLTRRWFFFMFDGQSV